ncbi:glycosyltransferase family 2 protein [Limnohabitans sp.]|uniref:glycosyltransferase family 2 protein n=1 Tax=Limnohabitans sp. TaxID=1907725 RepID=UPI003342DD85
MTDGTASAVNQGLLNEVTVVIVTFNSAHCLPELGRHLAACPHIIVVDNGSDDGCAQLALKHLPQAQVIALPTNLGFGAANNRALAQVQTPFALLLNPDCEITTEAIHRLLQTAHQWPDAAMVAPQLLQASGAPEVNYRWPHLLWHSQGPAVTDGPACVGFICGAAMLLRMSAFGGRFFDEQFFLYYEDDDLCTRLFNQRQAMVIDPSATATHRSRGSVRGKSPLRSEYLRGYHHAQSKLIYTRKYQSLHVARQQQSKLLWGTALTLPLRVLAFNPRLLARMWGRFRGVTDWKTS